MVQALLPLGHRKDGHCDKAQMQEGSLSLEHRIKLVRSIFL